MSKGLELCAVVGLWRCLALKGLKLCAFEGLWRCLALQGLNRWIDGRSNLVAQPHFSLDAWCYVLEDVDVETFVGASSEALEETAFVVT